MATNTQEMELIPLTEAACRLSVRYGLALNWILTRKLDGQKLHGRWMCTVGSVERVLREREPAPAA